MFKAECLKKMEVIISFFVKIMNTCVLNLWFEYFYYDSMKDICFKVC